ncbi:MAG: alkaline phosphatase family protein [Candidatus Coprovivens sp.]
MCKDYLNNTKLRFPDYDNSILCTISSVLKYYGIDNGHCSLKSLDKLLKKKFNNVVLIVLDGMGEHILNRLSKDGYFKRNELTVVNSVYPSTTTAAMTTYYSGKSPLETGWIAWSQYFKEYGRCLNMLPRVESYTEEKLKNVRKDVYAEVINYKSVYEMIEENGIAAYEICPSHVERKSKRTLIANDLDELCEGIKVLCDNPDKKFIMAYLDNPDNLLHKYGASSDEARSYILDAESKMERMMKTLNNSLVIISADHGHKDIKNVYSVLDHPDLRDCLIMPEFFESRFVGFWVKEDRKEEFENIFRREFKDYLLFTKKEVLEMGLLGNGLQHFKIDDFLGNYVAVSIGSSIFRLQNDYFEGKKVKKSTHCGLTIEEMDVPVIVLES